jgi:hypothetical protein
MTTSDDKQEELNKQFVFRPGDLNAKIVDHSIVNDKKPFVVRIINQLIYNRCIK